MGISFRTSVKADGREFTSFITLDVLSDGKMIGQIQSVEVAYGEMRRSTRQVENGAWIAWIGEQAHPDKEDRKMRRWASKAEAVEWIEKENS